VLPDFVRKEKNDSRSRFLPVCWKSAADSKAPQGTEKDGPSQGERGDCHLCEICSSDTRPDTQEIQMWAGWARCEAPNPGASQRELDLLIFPDNTGHSRQDKPNSYPVHLANRLIKEEESNR
jgi:hypothetical protein